MIPLSLFHRFNVENRSVVSHIFHQWAKKKAFQDPKRLLDKVISRYFDFCFAFSGYCSKFCICMVFDGKICVEQDIQSFFSVMLFSFLL